MAESFSVTRRFFDDKKLPERLLTSWRLYNQGITSP